MLYDMFMDEIRRLREAMQTELYDVVNELCQQMKMLRTELVELQHAIYSTSNSAQERFQ